METASGAGTRSICPGAPLFRVELKADQSALGAVCHQQVPAVRRKNHVAGMDAAAPCLLDLLQRPWLILKTVISSANRVDTYKKRWSGDRRMAADAGGSSYTASKGRMGQICRSFMEKSGRDILLWLLSVPVGPFLSDCTTKLVVSSLTRKNCLWSLSKIPWRGPVPLSKASSDTRVKSFGSQIPSFYPAAGREPSYSGCEIKSGGTQP